MANPISGYYSDLVLGKVDSSDEGYTVEEMSVTYADGMVSGMLVDSSGAALASTDAANAYGVILQPELFPAFTPEPEFTVGTAYTFIIGVRGLTLNKNLVLFADGTTVIDDTAIAVLAAKGLKITDKYYDGSTEIAVESI